MIRALRWTGYGLGLSLTVEQGLWTAFDGEGGVYWGNQPGDASPLTWNPSVRVVVVLAFVTFECFIAYGKARLS